MPLSELKNPILTNAPLWVEQSHSHQCPFQSWMALFAPMSLSELNGPFLPMPHSELNGLIRTNAPFRVEQFCGRQCPIGIWMSTTHQKFCTVCGQLVLFCFWLAPGKPLISVVCALFLNFGCVIYYHKLLSMRKPACVLQPENQISVDQDESLNTTNGLLWTNFLNSKWYR